MGFDWQRWHAAYGDPAHPLLARRACVSAIVRDTMDAAPAGPIRCLSLCAGTAEDLAGAAAGHPRGADLTGVAVELDRELAEQATGHLATTAPGMRVVCGDAARPSNWFDGTPVDLLLLVGIFGNISDEDVRATVAAVPSLAAAGAIVIWSRHRREPDLTPTIRQWFTAAGCIEAGFESPGPGEWSVGWSRVGTTTGPTGQTGPTGPPAEPLFTFIR